MVLRYFIRCVALYHQEENIHLLNVTIGNVVVIIASGYNTDVELRLSKLVFTKK